MKYLSKFTITLVFIALVIANIYVFLNSIKLSDKINQYEKGIKTLHQQNLTLENKVYAVDSLNYAASLAAQLNFTQKAQPLYLDNLKYARNQ